MMTRKPRIVEHVRRWPRRVVITVGIILLVLLAVRLALPSIVKQQVNARLQSVPGYTGQVEHIGLHLIRGAYSLGGVAIYKQSEQTREPFVLAKNIDFSLAWRELIHGRVVSDVFVDAPQITFIQGTVAEKTDADRRWQQVVKDLFPIDITHFEVKDGAVRYIDKTKQPNVDVFIKNMHVAATGLRNHAGTDGQEFPAEIIVEGDSLGGGRVRLFVQAEPLAAQPHFHLSAKVDGVNLPDLNDSMKAIANVDVGRGTFRMAAEMAGKDGGFQGYVKPFFEDLDFKNIEDKNKHLGERLWEKVVSGLAWLVKNKSRDQVGTRIPFEGRFGDPKIGLMATIMNTFRHGFVQAFNPTVEGTVKADNVLPSGKSANGKDVAKTKTEGPPAEADPKVGAPTGRPGEKPKK
ncbi:MAG TPA: DUF748 domain-containing protein [Opitutaceae bacterium]|nr:DUF748 domain-containing protein [Opitutaceae bacterium]